jgi:tripartite-type tricarboxylate transporter receptor subunit TctC
MHLIVASLALLACSLAAAQSYPNRPVKMVVPFSAGSGSDVYTRLIAKDFRTTFNQSFLVKNKGGASAQIGTLDVAKSSPDGYTLLTATNIGHSANPALYKKLAHDPMTDFTAIGHILYMPYLLVVSKTSPLSSVAGLIERARLAPNTLNCAYGNGSGLVDLAEFSSQAKIRTTAVPYKSMPPAMTDQIGGQVDCLFADVSNALPHLQSGSIKALGFSMEKRSVQLPSIPSIAETSGMAGFELTSWVELVGPAGMPAEIVERLNAQLKRTLAKPDIRDKLLARGAEIAPSTPLEMEQFVKQQISSWGTKIRSAGILPE